jgi:nucleotide-binding universal stress UspA family protein
MLYSPLVVASHNQGKVREINDLLAPLGLVVKSAAELNLPEARLTHHVLEAVGPAAALLEYAQSNRVDHIILGARESSLGRRVLGSVAAEVARDAPCSVTVVRLRPG